MDRKAPARLERDILHNDRPWIACQSHQHHASLTDCRAAHGNLPLPSCEAASTDLPAEWERAPHRTRA